MTLGALRLRAPAHLLDQVLASTGPVDDFVHVPGPVGPLMVAYNAHGISYVLTGDDEAELAAQVRRRLDRRVRRTGSVPTGLQASLRTGRTGAVRVDLRGRTAFEGAVLTTTCRIPPGEIRSYAWVAAAIGRPGAVRAVGSALGRNPVPVLIPCHRVVRTDGRIGDYVWGSATKRSLLIREGVDLDAVEQWGAAGLQYAGSDTTGIFCVPTCRHVRRITPAHLVRFRTAGTAIAAGFRPCRDCAPVQASP
ncbi:MAG: hypothetical protein NVS3B26_27120 [Mycobacteriales bacterium]